MYYSLWLGVVYVIFGLGVTNAWSLGGFGAAFLVIAGLALAYGIFALSSPMRVFSDNSIPVWKAFIPIYNMWVAFKEIAENTVLFFVWLALLIAMYIAAYFIGADPDSTGLFGFCILMSTFLPSIPVIREEGWFTGFYFVIVVDIMPAFVIIALNLIFG